jgi:biopolymer transport protein ExbD
MPFPVSRRGSKRKQNPDLNITSIIDIFITLVAFLLLNAVFAQTTVLDITLPTVESKDDLKARLIEEKEEMRPSLMISINKSGLMIGSVGNILPLIPKTVTGKYNYNELERQLKEIKVAHTEIFSAVILSSPEIEYHHIIKIMDICILNGYKDISLSGGIS